jgi:hypothetical protein
MGWMRTRLTWWPRVLVAKSASGTVALSFVQDDDKANHQPTVSAVSRQPSVGLNHNSVFCLSAGRYVLYMESVTFRVAEDTCDLRSLSEPCSGCSYDTVPTLTLTS